MEVLVCSPSSWCRVRLVYQMCGRTLFLPHTTSNWTCRAVWPEGQDDALLAAIFAAMVHDFEHKGLNNDFLIKTHDPLAVSAGGGRGSENSHHPQRLESSDGLSASPSVMTHGTKSSSSTFMTL